MSNRSRSLKIKHFERVMATPAIALLWVAAEASGRRPVGADERPTLVVDDGRAVTRFEALPSPRDGRGFVCAAYPVPAEVIAPETVFSLEVAAGDVIPLPAPVLRAQTPPPSPRTDTPPSQKLAAETRRPQDDVVDPAAAPDRIDALERRNAELEGSLRDRQAALEELDVWRGELERRLASMSTELGEVTGRLRERERQLQRVRGERDDPGARAGGDPVPDLTAAGGIDLEELCRAAAADAGEQAAQELAEAAAGLSESDF